MQQMSENRGGNLVHIVTLVCKDLECANKCFAALATYGRPDAMAYQCISYEFGLKIGSPDTVVLIKRWNRWSDLDALLEERVIPALPNYNELLKRPFDPSNDTVRIEMSGT